MNGHLETLPDEADALKQIIAQLTLTIADLEHEKRTHQTPNFDGVNIPAFSHTLGQEWTS